MGPHTRTKFDKTFGEAQNVVSHENPPPQYLFRKYEINVSSSGTPQHESTLTTQRMQQTATATTTVLRSHMLISMGPCSEQEEVEVKKIIESAGRNAEIRRCATLKDTTEGIHDKSTWHIV